MTMLVEVTAPVTTIVELTETELLVQTVESVQVVEVGIAGPQGVPGPTGATGATVLVDALADRPLTADDGDLFAANDTEEFFIWLGV
jgi:hypothetical protein